MTLSLYDQLGGETALRSIIDDFIDRVFDDVMIGFFFRSASRARIKEFEYQFAAAFFGADIVYGGRSLEHAHGPHPIMGGQFARRMRLLEETLHDHGVPQSIVDAWLAHNESLRPRITSDAGSVCDPEGAGRRVAGHDLREG